MSHQFYPGQRVVCVSSFADWVTKGAVYTVLCIGCTCGCRKDEFLTLHETRPWCSPCSWCGTPNGASFRQFRFRPFDELDAVIEEIEAMEAPVELETVEA